MANGDIIWKDCNMKRSSENYVIPHQNNHADGDWNGILHQKHKNS